LRRYLSTLVLIVGCATVPEVLRKSSAPVQPTWVNTTPTDNQYLYFVGAASGAESLDSGKSAAVSAATNQVAQYIGVNVKSIGKFVNSTNSADQLAQEETDTRASGRIQGAEAVETYSESMSRQVGATQIDRFDVWVLVRFPRAAADEERGRQAKEHQDRSDHAFELLGKARAAKLSGSLLDAMRALSDAKVELAALPGTVDIKNAEFRTSAELGQAVDHLSTDVQGALRKTAISADETSLGQPASKSVAANHVSTILSAKGFPVLPALAPVAGESPSALSGRAHAAGAAIAIQLQSTVTRSGTLYGTQAVCVAHVQAQALDVSSGEIVASAEKDGKGVKANEQLAAQLALAEAGDGVAQILLKALLDRERTRQ
jgi:hypothetical protein